MAARAKAPELSPQAAALLRGTGAPTHFAFDHKLFQAQGAAFRIDEASGRPCLAVDLGDVVAAMDLDALAPGFAIAPASRDAAMLELVRRALAPGASIAPGDAVPQTVLDGGGAWQLAPHHLLVAEGKIRQALVAWLGGDKDERLSPDELARLASAPATKTRLREGFGALAERLGLPASRAGEVLGRVMTLASELGYVEALRDRFDAIGRLCAKAAELHRQYSAEKASAERLARALARMAPPKADFEKRFAELDAKTDATADAMARLPDTIAFVRQARDALRADFRAWEPQLELWRDLPPLRGPKAERAAIYLDRFLQRQYPAPGQGTLPA